MSSVKIKIIDREGTLHKVEAPIDISMNLMEVCKAYKLDVQGTCGGMAICSSCHCYIKSDHQLPEKRDQEEDMLDQSFFVEDNSRLGCQLYISPEMDGLEIELAPEPY